MLTFNICNNFYVPYFALPVVVKNVTCLLSLYSTAVRGPWDLRTIVPLGGLACLKLWGISFLAQIMVPFEKVPLSLKSCINFRLANQLSTVNWWWFPKWGRIKSMTTLYLKHFRDIYIQNVWDRILLRMQCCLYLNIFVWC